MIALWRWLSLRHLFQEGGRTLLTAFGVALGVAVFVSIRLANHSALASFSDTVDSVAGRANLQVEADTGGFDERLYPGLRRVPGVRAAAPVVQTYALAGARGAQPGRPGTRGSARTHDEDRSESRDALLILGVDPFAEAPFGRYRPPERVGRLDALAFLADPRAAAITRTLAGRHGLKLGDPLVVYSAGQPVRLNVRQILVSEELQQAMGGNVVLMDIATAQEAFSRYGKLDRVDLLVDPERKAEVTAAISALLPPHVSVGTARGRTAQVENMVEAFGLSLTSLSFIALLVSMFLIFNAVSMAVLRRRREIGILRSLGVTRGGIVAQFLAEALFVGLAGSLAGLLLGTLLARATLGSIARTLTDLYLVVHAEAVRPDPATYWAGLVLGTGSALLSALVPALEAARTPPNVATRQGMLIEAQPLPIRRWAAVGAAMLIVAAAIALWTVGRRQALGGFISATLTLLGFSLLAPAFTLGCERLAAPVMRALAGIEGVLGARYLREAVARTSIVVAALMVSVGMLVGMSTMVGSFRKTVDVWVGQSIRGDLYAEPVGRRLTGSATVLPPEVIEIARSLPEVAAVDTYRGLQISYGGRLAYVTAIDFAIQESFGGLQFLRGNAREILSRARREGGVVVTESFAFRHRARVGDRVTLRTPTGVHHLPVEGVFYDYSSDAGAIMMDRHLYARLWRDPRTESLALYLRPGADVDRARSRFIAAVGERVLMHVTPNRALRERVLTVFDQTFRITYALQAIAVLVAVLGVVSTLTALILQRGREIAVLRAAGALRRQVRKMVLVESALLGAIGAALGCACGLALAVLLIHVINKQFFGWSIRMSVDPWLFLQAFLLMVGTALAAGIGPARLAATRVAAEAMRIE